MTPTDIDRILHDEAPIEPSPRFTPRVMRAVGADMTERHARRLAWRQTWPGVAVASVLVPVAVAARSLGGSQLATAPTDAALWLALTIVGTLALASWCTRLVTRH